MSLCYIITGMKNKFINDFKLEIRLNLSVSKASCIIINIMNSIDLSFCYVIVNNYK